MRLLNLALVASLAVVPVLASAQKHNHDHGAKKAKPAAAKKDDHGHDHDHDHGHHHEAPHGGTLVVFGDEFAHLELVLDNKEGSLTGYVLDGEAVKGIAIKQEVIQLELSGGDLKSSAAVTLKSVANPLTGETAGNSSEFQGKHDALKKAKKFKVKIRKIEIKGQTIEDLTVKFPEGNH